MAVIVNGIFKTFFSDWTFSNQGVYSPHTLEILCFPWLVFTYQRSALVETALDGFKWQTDHMHLYLETERQTCRLPFILHSHRGHLTGESPMQPKERWGPTGVLWKLQSLWQRIFGGGRMSMEFENIKAGRGVLCPVPP